MSFKLILVQHIKLQASPSWHSLMKVSFFLELSENRIFKSRGRRARFVITNPDSQSWSNNQQTHIRCGNLKKLVHLLGEVSIFG